MLERRFRSVIVDILDAVTCVIVMLSLRTHVVILGAAMHSVARRPGWPLEALRLDAARLELAGTSVFFFKLVIVVALRLLFGCQILR